MPDVPTLVEQGLPNYNLAGWIAVIAPAGLPAAEAAKINGDITTALASPEVKQWMTAQDFTSLGVSADATLQFFQSEQARYAQLVKQAGVTLE
jgi:tripartite-type tricarboxylate transporter receptor subunit TctC